MQEFSYCMESESHLNPYCQLQEWDPNPNLYPSLSPANESLLWSKPSMRMHTARPLAVSLPWICLREADPPGHVQNDRQV